MEHCSSTPPPTTPVLQDVSVVIPTTGRHLLLDTLQSIADGDAWPASLIVVNQGRETPPAEWVQVISEKGIRCRHVMSDGRGTAAGTNEGVENVATPFVAVTHDDCRVAADWLRRMTERLREAPKNIITGRVLAEGPEPVPSVITSPHARVFDRPLLKRDPLFPANMGFSIDTARRIGPFDENPVFATAEDCEWSYRALRQGTRIVYAPEVVVTHAAWRDSRARRDTYASYARSLGGFYGTYIRRGDAFILLRLLHDLARGPWMVLRAAVTRNSELGAIGRAYVSQLVPGVIAGLRRRDDP